MTFNRIKPAVSKYLLIALAGLMWSTVGVMLCSMAYYWLKEVDWLTAFLFGLFGIILSLAAYRFGFSGIAKKNIDRICLLPERGCIFAFQAWKSYLIIVVMIAVGIILRHSPIPKHYLAIVYTTIGGALLLSSLHYYRRLWQLIILKKP
ncbi:MAG: hypothetical protein KKI12_08910 [Proteobacteria bacterium]|nr:hypothetical protein [Pseudomonadota bacterium]MBU4288274.1 hypothetical protein [Pseudomonadota bacterium]MBU4413967.1 hypothetical protein [Pseudomonadota bacterium]